MNPVQKETVRNWIEELRSGNYPQGQSALCWTLEGEKKFCCLGVLCEMIGAKTAPSRLDRCLQPLGIKTVYVFGDALEINELPRKVFESLTGLLWDAQNLLMHLNDGGASFDQIASYLEYLIENEKDAGVEEKDLGPYYKEEGVVASFLQARGIS